MKIRFLAIGMMVLWGLMAATPVRTEAAPAAATTTQPVKAHNYKRWEKNIAEFEEQDRKKMPEKGGILFVGSSSIVRWKTLAQDFEGYNVINRGFGGNEICDSTYYADRMIFPYEPKQIFLRAGGNDIHAHKSAEEVLQEFKDFVAKVHGKLPETEIVYISMAPAPSRWDERFENKKANELIRDWAKDQPNVKYCETYDTTITPDGKPREELFVKDRLHFNPEGYKLMVERVRPFLMK